MAELLGSGAMGASPLLHAWVAGLHMASRDIASVTQREVRAAEDALSACREMLEIPVQTAMLAMCCAAPRPLPSSADDVVPPPPLLPRSPSQGAVPAGLSPTVRGAAVGAVPAAVASDGGSPAAAASPRA